MDSATMFRALELAGIIEQRTYLSTTGSGETKTYWAFTDGGLRFGVNQTTVSPVRTEPRFYEDSFRDAMVVAAEAIMKTVNL